MADLSKTGIFRMLHIENVPHVQEHGITHASSPNANPAYVPIGDSSLIGSRDQYILPNGKKLGSYIPFYFGTRTPMLYVIQKGYNMVTPTLPEDIVYCVSTVQQIIDLDLPFLFTNGHAISELTSYFDRSNIDDLDQFVKKEDVQATYWKKGDDADLKRRKEAEFLVESDIPPESISFWLVYNATVKKKLIEMGITEKQILVIPSAYY